MSQNEFKNRLRALMNLPENQFCCDCNDRRPSWASIIVPPPGSPPGTLPIGAFCCLECSGSHRKLGVHITFVRSVSLDSCKSQSWYMWCNDVIAHLTRFVFFCFSHRERKGSIGYGKWRKCKSKCYI
jgi:hypothetical protein